MPRPSWAMALATVATGLAAGAGGIVINLLLHLVEHAAFGYQEGSFASGVQAAPDWRRVAGLSGGGLVVGVGWWLLRRWTSAPVSVTAAVRDGRPLPVGPAILDAVLQITAVGAGASLGREGAPRQVGAAVGGWLADRLGLGARRRRVLLACGAGAGLTAIYNVPLGGVLFTLEIMLHSIALADVVPAALSSAIATVVTWPVFGDGPTYRVPAPAVPASVLVSTVVIGPAAGVVGLGFRRAATAARVRAVRGWRSAVAIPVTFAALGAIAVGYPFLLGNGKALAQVAFADRLSVGAAVVVVVLKPLATAACLRAGAIGGLLTPSFSTGATLGLALGIGWSRFWPGDAGAAFAVVGAGAVLAVTQRAPLTAVVLAEEFTHAGDRMLVPIILAVALALVTSAGIERAVHSAADRSLDPAMPPDAGRR